MTMLRATSALLAYAALARAWSTFVVPHTDGADDTPALMAAVSGYSSDATILFQAGTTYNIWSPITFPKFTNVEVAIEGNLTYPTSIETIQNYVAAANYSGAWFTFTGGSNVTLRGSTDPNWGWVDGHGQQWWDLMQQVNRPHGWSFAHIATGVIRNMKLYQPIAWNFQTSGTSNLHAYNNVILARSNNASSFPFNTDGFSASGTNFLFENNHIVNGDDCLTVGSGAKNITWRDTYCEGGHGLSIGSLGKGGQVALVENIVMENTVMNRTLYGARFKSWSGGNGAAVNVTWRNIHLFDVMFPIYVTQNYWDQGIGPRPNLPSTNETRIENFLFENFEGTINDTPGYVEGSCVSDPCWYYVPGATGKEVIILDLYPNTATNVMAKNLHARTLTGAPVAAMCNSSTITGEVGFTCQNGPYIPTKGKSHPHH